MNAGETIISDGRKATAVCGSSSSRSSKGAAAAVRQWQGENKADIFN